MSPEQFQNELEALMDKGGIRLMLDSIAAICSAKADHIRSNWQDEMLARAWEMQSKTMLRAHEAAKKLGL